MAAKRHDFTWTEIKAGLLVAAAILALGLFIAVIQGLRPPETVANYVAFFSDTAGLNRGADVRYGGVKVGRVAAIGPSADNRSLIKVVAHVATDVPVNEASRAYITQTTLTAEKHLEITTGQEDAALLPSGSVLETQVGGLFGQLAAVGGEVSAVLEDVRTLIGVQAAQANEEKPFASVADVLAGVDSAVQEAQGAVGDVRGVIEERRSDLAEIAQKVKEIENEAHALVVQLADIVGENRSDLRDTVGNVRQTAERVESLAAGLEVRMESITTALEAALQNTEGLTGEAQALVDANRPLIEDTLYDLRETIRYLKEFARTVAEDPDTFIRGKQPEGRR
jgi:phospholipid/cholesterol/gamma-HCH transport system substrate-binding protein